MHRSIGIAVLAAFAFLAECLVRANGSSEELIPQIKIVGAEVLYHDPKYFKSIDINVDKHNATYNNAHLNFELIQDFPPDIVVNINVYATNSKYEEETLLLKESIPVCKDSPKRHLWVLLQRLEKYKPNECIKKGKYKVANAGSFRFDLEIPNIHQITDYQYSTSILYIKDEKICEVKWYGEWGYLNNTS